MGEIDYSSFLEGQLVKSNSVAAAVAVGNFAGIAYRVISN